MNRVLIWGLIGAFLGGVLAVLIATAGDEGEIFIPKTSKSGRAAEQHEVRHAAGQWRAAFPGYSAATKPVGS